MVACLASFRALFASKERAREALEALEREREDERKSSGRGGLKLGIIKARAKYFQDSLFDTGKNSKVEGGMSFTELTPRTNSHDNSYAPSKADSTRTDKVPELNMHEFGTEFQPEKRV